MFQRTHLQSRRPKNKLLATAGKALPSPMKLARHTIKATCSFIFCKKHGKMWNCGDHFCKRKEESLDAVSGYWAPSWMEM